MSNSIDSRIFANIINFFFQRSIERALPIIHKDVDSTLMNLGLKTEAFFHEANKRMGPYLTEAGKKAEVLWVEIQRRNDLVCCRQISYR